MHEDPLNLPPPDAELERALSHLRPSAPPDTRRDTIAFEAGRRSARRSLTLWRTTTATLAAALSLTLFLPHHATAPAPTSPPLASAPPPPPALPSPPGDWQLATGNSSPGYLALRDAVLARGLDALPPDPPSAAAPRHADRPPPRAIELQPYPLHLPTFFGERS